MSKEEEQGEKIDDYSKERVENKNYLKNNDNKTGNKQINIDHLKNNDKININKIIRKISVKQNELALKRLKEEENEKNVLLFNKKLNNLNELSEIADSKLDMLINRTFRINLKKKINFHTPENKLLLEKEMQLKNDQVMLKILSKENKKLKREKECLNQKLLNAQDLFAIDQISLKNKEIQELKQKNIELSKKLNEIKNINTVLESKNKQLEEIIIRYKKKLLELKPEDNKEKTIYIHSKKRKNNDLLKSASTLNFIKNKQNQKIKEIINNSVHHILSHRQKKSLKNIFNSNEEFENFNKKINIIETRNKKVENKLEKQISNLNDIISDQRKENNNLKEDIELRDKKIRFLENQLNKLKEKNKILINNNKKYLSIEEQLKKNEFDIDGENDKDKMQKINILLNFYKEELNKNYVEKCKEEEINKINKEIGDIYFFDSKFFKKFSKNKKVSKDE